MHLKNSQVCFELNEIKLYDCVELEPISALVFNFVGDLEAYWTVDTVRLNDARSLSASSFFASTCLIL